eukprot:TRINITY_DN5128_c0_g2_i1.p1 TRINITY_DN5128_c0_g2~~TRINITY_DN5128_c0_g2_i1.p1  ORF type:complete len:170 (+),score=18.16 TRINITY_DN5128_c0_g2_i1:154-663(+)
MNSKNKCSKYSIGLDRKFTLALRIFYLDLAKNDPRVPYLKIQIERLGGSIHGSFQASKITNIVTDRKIKSQQISKISLHSSRAQRLTQSSSSNNENRHSKIDIFAIAKSKNIKIFHIDQFINYVNKKCALLDGPNNNETITSKKNKSNSNSNPSNHVNRKLNENNKKKS